MSRHLPVLNREGEVIGVNVFELFAKIALDTKDYEKGLSDSESKTQKFAQALGNGLKTAAKIGTAAVTAASTAVVALTKQSIESYAEYEQLIGGVQTLFSGTQKSFQELEAEMTAQGKTTTEVVAKWAEYQKGVTTVASNAANAYKTAGMSANEYMSTVTSFSASLIQSLDGDTAKAAEVADRAITDMSDNANKMGTDISMIQNAYQGFAKQNYTMLDNLKLGYGGTKEEMARLIEDASKMAAVQKELGITVKEGDMSFGNIANAISVVQKNMGIMGTTAKEAGTTIQGSLSSTKAAWSNLLTGMADEEADFDQLIENFVTSIVGDGTKTNKGLFGNILPRIEVALGGIGDLVAKLAPYVVGEIPVLIETVLPSMIEAVVGLVTVVGTTISDNAPMLLQSALDLLTALDGALIDNLPMLIDTVPSLLTQLATWLGENAGTFAQSAVDLIVGLAESLVSNLPELIPAIISIITQLVTTLTEPDNLALLLDAALAIIIAIAEGLINSIPNLITACLDILGNIISFFSDDEQKQKVRNTALELGKRLIEGLWEGVKAMGRWMRDKLFGWFDDLIGDVKENQEIHSPSKLWARIIGKPVGQGVGVGAIEGLEESEAMIQDKLDNMVADVESRTVEVTPKIETATASGAVAGVDFNALASTSIDGIASIAKSVDYNALVNASLEGIGVLVDLFTSGNAKVGVDNTRDLRRALNA